MQLDSLYCTFFKPSISSCCSIWEYSLHKNPHASASRILPSHNAESKTLQEREKTHSWHLSQSPPVWERLLITYKTKERWKPNSCCWIALPSYLCLHFLIYFHSNINTLTNPKSSSRHLKLKDKNAISRFLLFFKQWVNGFMISYSHFKNCNTLLLNWQAVDSHPWDLYLGLTVVFSAVTDPAFPQEKEKLKNMT